MKKYIINKSQNGMRLESFIKSKIDANQAFLSIMLRKKIVKVNGVHPKDYKIILNEHDEVCFYLDDKYFKNEFKLPFDCIYEDENIIIIDKPKNMPVHSTQSLNHNNVLDLVIKYLISKGEYNPSISTSFKPALNFRIDTNTIGLVLISKNKETLELINSLIMNKKISKHYLAIVKGKMENKEDIYKDYYILNQDKSFATITKEKVSNSKEVITGYKVIEQNSDYSILDVDLITGRTHQIRSHMAFHNHPILGDTKYGDKEFNKKYNKSSQELISYRLSFPDNDLKHLEYLRNKSFTSNFTIKI